MPTPDNQDDTKPKDEEELEKEEPKSKAEDNQDTPPDSTDQDDTDWKASYQGLQRSFDKKRKELEGQIEKLTVQVNKLTEDTETVKSDKTSLEGSNKTLADQLAKATEDLETVTSEKAALELRAERQSIIMEEFKEVAPMAGYIPPGKDLDEFRDNAKKFAEDLGKMVDTGVSEELSGASPPPPGGDDTVSASDVDKLYDEVVKLAGDPDKTKEYETAYDAYLEALNRNSAE
jgi:DNA repair exonuclease SbcCD ATPase subunit